MLVSAQNAWRTLHTQLFTPISLNRYGGNILDEDPRYNYTEHFPHDVAQRTQFMLQPCLSVYDHLDFGALSMGYDGLWVRPAALSLAGCSALLQFSAAVSQPAALSQHNTSTPNIYATMTPTTPVEIGEGLIIAIERTITSRAGVIEPPAGAGPYKGSKVYTYHDCYLESVVAGGLSVNVEQLRPRDIVIVVWE